jgi:hypothetical protein
MDIAVPSQAKNKNKYANCKYTWTVFSYTDFEKIQ